MTRGGKRDGAGRKKSSDPTITIRIPKSQKETIQDWVKNACRTAEPKPTVQSTIDMSLTILKNSLSLKANAGGRIKTEIRKAIAILQLLDTNG